MIHKKIKKSLCLCLLVLSLCIFFTGCGKKENESDKLSRAEYVGLLGDTFGINEYENQKDYFGDVSSSNKFYSQIQACTEWEVLESADKFEPESYTTLKFAIESAVKAVGLDKIEKSGKQPDEKNLADFYVDNIANIDISNPDMQISKETAEQIINYALEYRNDIELPQVCEIDFQDGVKNADTDIYLNYDGKSGIIKDSSKYKVGDVVYWKESDTSMARGIKITSISNNVFQYVDAQPEEIYSSVKVQGTYKCNVIEAVSASNSTYVSYQNKSYDNVRTSGLAYTDNRLCSDAEFLANGVKVNKGKDYVTFKAEISGKSSDKFDAEIYGDIVVSVKNIDVTADVDYKLKRFGLPEIKEVGAKVSFDTEISSTIKADCSRSIPLGEVYINISGPLNMRLSLTANIGANGEVSISYNTANDLYVGWKANKGLQKSFTSSPSLNYNANATLTAEATAMCEILLGYKDFSINITNAEVTTGLVAVGKTDGDLLSSEPLCTDVLVYVPLRWGVNQRACVLTEISSKLKYEQTIWDSSNSKFQLHLHFENNIRTKDDKCTRGEEKEIIQENTDEKGAPIDEVKLFTFERMEFDFIKFETYVVYLDENSTAKIGISHIPEGYDEKDLVYEVENKSVCSVSEGNITSLDEGSTVVRVRTEDGMFSTAFAVIVFGSYSVEDFNPI